MKADYQKLGLGNEYADGLGAIYQSSFGGGFNQYGGGVGGSTMAAGSVNFRFRCGQ